MAVSEDFERQLNGISILNYASVSFLASQSTIDAISKIDRLLVFTAKLKFILTIDDETVFLIQFHGVGIKHQNRHSERQYLCDFQSMYFALAIKSAFFDLNLLKILDWSGSWADKRDAFRHM